MLCVNSALARRQSYVPGLLAGALLFASPAFPQGRGGSDWSAAGADAQRSSWVRSDPKISPDALQKPGFQLLWKVKFRDGAGPLSAPALQDRYIGYRGFRTYAFIGGAADSVFTLDSDLGRIEWQKQFPLNAKPGNGACPGGMTASVTRDLGAAFPSNLGRGGGGGRGGPAKSGVGAPGEGAVTLAAVAAPARGPANQAAANAAPAAPPRRLPSFLRALSSDGALHSLYISNGEEPEAPLKFLPPNAHASGLIVVDNIAYVVTSGNCGGVPDGVWALDLASKSVATFKAAATGIAFGPDGTVYSATAAGDLLALDPRTLTQTASYSAGQPFLSAPIVFPRGTQLLVAAAAKDGSIHLLQANNTLSKLAVSEPGAAGHALSTWQDPAGARWLLASSPKGINAWKLTEQSGALGFQSGWTSQAIPAALTPAIVNGVVFTASPGSTSRHAVLYALDALTGKELWSSGNTITSPIAPNADLAAGGSAVCFGTQDGTFWAFGMPIEH